MLHSMLRACGERRGEDGAEEKDIHQQHQDQQGHQQEHREDHDGKSHRLQGILQVPQMINPLYRQYKRK